jgi:hypothetical protein
MAMTRKRRSASSRPSGTDASDAMEFAGSRGRLAALMGSALRAGRRSVKPATALSMYAAKERRAVTSIGDL